MRRISARRGLRLSGRERRTSRWGVAASNGVRLHWLIANFLVGLLFFQVLAVQVRTSAQDQTLPNTVYLLAFQPYYSGEFRDAARGFREAAQGGRIGVDGRWVDAVCYHTMMGECYYHMGDLPHALEQYDAAAKLFLAHKDWMLKLELPATISASASNIRSRINWASSRRASKLGQYPERVSALFGNLNNNAAIRGGGVVQPPEYRPVRANEIARCTALAIRRRGDILGPTCQFAPLTNQLIGALSTRPAPPNHWSQAWVGVQLGLAYASAGRAAEAVSTLSASLLAAGQYDHHLTGMALLELGKIAFGQGKFDTAATYLLEATLASAEFDHFDDAQEAFELATANHIVSGQKGVYPPLANAINWARRDGSAQLHASLLLLAAESNLAQGQTAAAAGLIGQSLRAMGRTDLPVSALGGRRLYHAAHAAYQAGNAAEAVSLLASSLVIGRKASPWLFQIGVAEKLLSSNVIGPRTADQLFQLLLREPAAKDWKLNPQETLAVLTTPLEQPMGLWFELVLSERKDQERAFEISDRIRRRRFFNTLSFGGRLMALRWTLEAPKEAINDKAGLQRQDLLLRYPAYAEISAQAKAVREQLRGMPLVLEDEARRDQEKLLGKLATLCAMQEAMLGDIALRREPSEFAFPPLLDVKTIQEQMPANQLTLAYFNTPRAVYISLITKTEYMTGVISDARSVERELKLLLQELGHYDRNQVQVAEHLLDDQWKEPAKRLWKMLVPESAAGLWKDIDELVIVPDGILWYVPFESLQTPTRRGSIPLISKYRIRFAPTLGTSLPHRLSNARGKTMAVVTGKMFPRDAQETAVQAFDELRAAVPTAVRIESRLPAPSYVYSTLCDSLVVLDEVDDKNTGPYTWAPMQADRGKPGSTLADWFSLPWQSPELLVLPGFQTAAGDGLRRGGNGNEMFLAVCGLMSTGARTILISRWRTGGQMSFDLTREFLQQLPRMSPEAAWQRSVHLVMAGEANPEYEPRVKTSRLDESLPARHPFFWAAYMLVD